MSGAQYLSVGPELHRIAFGGIFPVLRLVQYSVSGLLNEPSCSNSQCRLLVLSPGFPAPFPSSALEPEGI